jgi:hypothetical protein
MAGTSRTSPAMTVWGGASVNNFGRWSEIDRATLLSRNLKDFGRVPDLRVENWLD